MAIDIQQYLCNNYVLMWLHLIYQYDKAGDRMTYRKNTPATAEGLRAAMAQVAGDPAILNAWVSPHVDDPAPIRVPYPDASKRT